MQNRRESDQQRKQLIQSLWDSLSIFGSFPDTEFISFGNGIACYYSNTPITEENYLLLPFYSNEFNGKIIKSIEYFKKNKLPFVCPLLSPYQKNTIPLLKENGLHYYSVLRGMICDNLNEIQKRSSSWIYNVQHGITLANAIWEGFDSLQHPPRTFINFINNALKCNLIRLYGMRKKKQLVATAMLTLTPSSAGLYYVSTLPEFRGQGLAFELISEVLSDASKLGYASVSLLATPAGAPLYLKYGFRDIYKAEVYCYENK